MAIKRYTADADNTITNAFKANLQTRGTDANMGESDIVETFVIYGQTYTNNTASLEEARILVKFPIDDIHEDRLALEIPEAGNVDFYLRVHNAPHGQTLPRDYNLKVCPISGSWDEGYGLDMESYSDLGASNWEQAKKTRAWLWDGGDFYTYPEFTQAMPLGTEDVELNITELVEEWLLASADPATGKPNDGLAINISSSVIDPFSVDISALRVTLGNEDGVLDRPRQWYDLGTPPIMSAAETASFDISTALCRTAISGSSDTWAAWLTVDIGATEAAFVDTERTGSILLTPTDSSLSLFGTVNSDCTYITGSTVVFLFTDTFEFAHHRNDIDLTLHLPTNIARFDRSYYIKKFFARGSEHFYLRPKIEARWDSAKKDRRNTFYASSSLVPAGDNLNTLYIYNYARGELQNIPAVGTGPLSMSLYDGASGAPAGAELQVTDSAGGSNTSVEGGWVTTGIYSASVAINTTSSYLYDVWHSGAGTEYVTGSQISVRSFATETAVDTGEYVSNITNLKEKYSTSEKPRMRMFVRDKDWSPTIYTVATTNIETKVIEDAYFKVFRVADDFDVISYGTGSLNEGYTQMSYDKDGNYFDIDMSLFETGYSYGIKVSYKRSSVFNEQPELFKFRVE
jgi:hypothetical protein